MLPLVFGRIMVIETIVRVRATEPPFSHAFLISEQHQHEVYSEVSIAGDLSPDDVDRASKHLREAQVSWQ